MSNRKPIFFTADWHIGHAAILKYDGRPFKDVNHMREVLINNYNSTVPEDGICYFLGDMGLTKSDTLKDTISRMHGTKVLLLGNHDAGINALYRIGFDAVLYNAALVIAKELVTMSHCPLLGVLKEDVAGMSGAKPGDNWHGEHKNKRYSVHNTGQFHLHGHIHSTKKNKILGKQFDVGVRANEYRPISISSIESWISLSNKKVLE